jgi:hypothetical protein
VSEPPATFEEERDSYKRYVLGNLRLARVRARMLVAAIDNIGVALKSGAIDVDEAVADLHNAGGMRMLDE